MIETLEKYYNDGWLIKQVHPTKDLTIWNYSRQTQWEKHWDDITLMCRGLVTNSQGKIVSRCFKKFFNMEELNPAEIPNEPFEITEKMDGQLGLLFFYDNEWIFASRGSFASIYAEKGRQLLEKYKYKKLDTRYTYIFEIIFKEGRIVCKYDFEDLIMLGCINIETGIEKKIHNAGFDGLGFKLVKKFDGINDFKTIKAMIADDAEGYVVQFRSGLRMKIKGKEYIRLHNIITKISSRDIWEYLKENKPINELLENVPDEFDVWVKEQISSFKTTYSITEANCQLKYFNEIKPFEKRTRKELAKEILKYDKSLQPIFFHMFDGKDYSHLIWNKIYPKYEKPFNKNDQESNN